MYDSSRPMADEHEQAAPQQVRDVQLAPAELGIVRDPQLQADDEDGRHGADKHRVLQ
jgi:hypothetical protein